MNRSRGGLGMHWLWHGRMMLRILRRKGRIRVVVRSRLMHGMHLLLLVRIPICSILLRILWHHGTHVLRKVWLVARM